MGESFENGNIKCQWTATACFFGRNALQQAWTGNFGSVLKPGMLLRKKLNVPSLFQCYLLMILHNYLNTIMYLILNRCSTDTRGPNEDKYPHILSFSEGSTNCYII